MKELNTKRFKRSIAFFIFFSFLLGLQNVQAQDDEIIKQGQGLFMSNCASCHKVTAQKLVGPGLAGVRERWENEENLIKWIQNSQVYLKEENDSYAKKLYAEYNNSVMPAFAISSDEVKSILAYIDNPPPVPGPGGGGGAEVAVAEQAFSWTNPMTIFMILVAAILLAMAIILSRLLGTLGRMAAEKVGDPIPEPVPVYKRLLDKRFLALASILLLVFLGFTAFDITSNIGRQQNYAPTQPIAFSHQLHAGINGVDCQYCHSGAAKGKSAVIPSANVCMNCHKAISEGPEYGKEEIAKIYAAVDWDPETQTYGDNPKPIEWVRIHNLPDHVYFNHAQHVAVGGIECQECHGKVEEMKVLAQHSTLGMGWCIDCHRETEIQFASNDYYEIYEQFHDDLKEGKKTGVTVENIGGTECQKCHY